MTLGNYQVIQELGTGGMGKVFLARHLHTERPVVIKVLLPEYARNDLLVQRFYTEARILADLDHPAIVRLYDFAVENGVPYLVMEYVHGTPLEKVLESEGAAPLGLEWAYAYLKPIFEALSYVHAKDIIHRDIKPSNIMILPEGGAKLLDFGIAKAMDAEYKLTQTGTQVGTALYMAPEQIQGSQVTPRTDLYAMGLILYQCAFGQYPWEWQGKTLFQIYQTILTAPPPLPAYAPAEQRAFFERALAKAPEERFPSAEAMLKGLRQLVSPSKQSTPSGRKDTGAHAAARIEALDSPPTYTRESIPAPDKTEKASRGGSILVDIIAGGAALLAGALLHKPLGIIGGAVWGVVAGGLVYGILYRSGGMLMLSGFFGGLLGYFYLYAYPKARKVYDQDAAIHSALTAEIERYRADSLPYILRRNGISHQKVDVEIAPLPAPSEPPGKNLPLSEIFRILRGKVRGNYPTSDTRSLDVEVEFVKDMKHTYSRERECTMSCGFWGERTCRGTQTVWFSDSWKESCTLRGDLSVRYNYDPESERMRRHFTFTPSGRPACRELAGTRVRRVEYEGLCR